MSAQIAKNLGNMNGDDHNSYESKKTAGQVDMMKNTLVLAYQKNLGCVLMYTQLHWWFGPPLIAEVFGIYLFLGVSSHLYLPTGNA